MTATRLRALLASTLVAVTLTAAGQLIPGSSPEPILVGAVFPLSSSAGPLARQEELGVRIAADLVNADGGIDGRPVALDVRDLERGADAPAVMAALRAEGAQVVIGAYASDLSIAASAAAADVGLVYWEAGAVADRLTGRGLPMVFRVGASGTNLGFNSASFAASQLALRLGKPATSLRLAIVAADDDYATSVADAAAREAEASGVPIVLRATYDLILPRWPQLMGRLSAAGADVIILASHIPDGIAFRRAMLAAKLKVGALIGSTMAECSPDFAGELGPDAVGIFASDRPTAGFQPGVLGRDARVAFERLASAWASAGGPTPASSPDVSPDYGQDQDREYAIQGPMLPATAGPTEEGLSGFSAAWALFGQVLPAAAHRGVLDAAGIAAAARHVDLPIGSLPNGAGIRFSTDPATLGQNLRATAVIWQWQAVRSYTFVWPPTYATGRIAMVPLPR
ncbi:MAG: amino acid ABC transporter substrate-binding protein [Chloroflexi bacterium]|nr:MAG: amino acid ABC transporter substrate-binding protein [Chloroflexota bacterium]